jgi:hypothetical protein
MVWKTSEANFALNDIPGLCVNYVHRSNSTDIFLFQCICFLAKARFSAFKLYDEELKFYYILNFIIRLVFTLL